MAVSEESRSTSLAAASGPMISYEWRYYVHCRPQGPHSNSYVVSTAASPSICDNRRMNAGRDAVRWACNIATSRTDHIRLAYMLSI